LIYGLTTFIADIAFNVSMTKGRLLLHQF